MAVGKTVSVLTFPKLLEDRLLQLVEGIGTGKLLNAPFADDRPNEFTRTRVVPVGEGHASAPRFVGLRVQRRRLLIGRQNTRQCGQAVLDRPRHLVAGARFLRGDVPLGIVGP